MGTVDEKLRRAVEERYLELLKSVFGQNLISVVAYGSYASGTYVRGASDINLLIIQASSIPEQLEELGRKGRTLTRRYAITPQVLTKTEFYSSADVFPMEYMDIRAAHVLLYGEDPTASMKIEKKNLRHQLEDRLRGMVASLRKILIASEGRKRRVGRYLKAYFGPYGALLRGLLRLKDISPVPYENEALLSKVGGAFGIRTEPFHRLVLFRSGKKSARGASQGAKAEADAGARESSLGLARSILASLEELITAIDRMES